MSEEFKCVITPNVRHYTLKSLNVEIAPGWHFIADGDTGQVAVRFTSELALSKLRLHGKRRVTGACLFAKGEGPFNTDIDGEIRADGTLDYASISLDSKTDAEGYTFAHPGDWIVLMPNGEIIPSKDWHPSWNKPNALPPPHP